MAGATFVPEVDYVHKIGCVEWVNGFDSVSSIPNGYFPTKSKNFEQGGKTLISPQIGIFTGAYIPEFDCQLKRINISFSAYNIEDTIDIKVGDKYLALAIPVVEMADSKILEMYRDIPAGTPIIICYNNYSGTEKWMFYSFSTLVDEEVADSGTDFFTWSYYWSGYSTLMPPSSLYSYIIPMPEYANTQSEIRSFTISVGGVETHSTIATITMMENGNIISDYEVNNVFAAYKTINIIGVTVVDEGIKLDFINTATSNTIGSTRIGMDFKCTVNNYFI